MATRHSFLSTTGLLRTPSSTSSITDINPPVRMVRDHVGSSNATLSTTERDQSRSKNLKKLTLRPLKLNLRASAGVVPLGPTFIVGIAVIISLFFIFSISFTFVGAEDEAVFKDILNDLAQSNPGILLIGDNVDVDVDEPAVTVRWSIIACGQAYVLPGSEGTHGSQSCGIPNVPLNIYVDGEETPTATYDPDKIPASSVKSNRLSVQNLYQFDSDHVLDVHEARLYPFDTYVLTSTIRIELANSTSPAQVTRLLTIYDTSSFTVSSSDTASTVTVLSSSSSDETTQSPSRDLDLTIQRPGEARFFALMLFGINWMLAHATVGYVALAHRSSGSQKAAYYLVVCVVTLLIIPQIRNVMPDAPGYDGVLIDQIGLFSQMVLSGGASVALLAILAKRELAQLEAAMSSPGEQTKASTVSEGLKRLKGPSASIDFRHIRSLSKRFLTRVEPPSPITEYPDTTSLLDPFAAQSPTSAYGISRIPYAPRGTTSSDGQLNKSTSLMPANAAYSEWV